jgi:hypothetical protein
MNIALLTLQFPNPYHYISISLKLKASRMDYIMSRPEIIYMYTIQDFYNNIKSTIIIDSLHILDIS